MINQMKLIKNNDINRACAVFAEMFEDYPLYSTLLGTEGDLKKKIYYLFKVEVSLGERYTYANEDFTAICSIIRPDDKGKERSLASLFVNPFFAIPFFKAVSRKEAKIAMEYVSFAEQVSEPFYNP